MQAAAASVAKSARVELLVRCIRSVIRAAHCSTVVCAPVYGEILGLRSEVTVGAADGLPRSCAIRCDFLTLVFKSRLTRFAGVLKADKIEELDCALRYALDLQGLAER